MFKKVILGLTTIVFLSLPSLAQERSLYNSSFYSIPLETKNTIMLGVGKASSKMDVSFNGGETYERYPDIEQKFNIDITFLRQLDSLNKRLSLGVDVSTYVSSVLDATLPYNDGASNIDLNFRGKYSVPLSLIYLIDYKIIDSTYFDFSIFAGIGMSLHNISGAVTATVLDPNGNPIAAQERSGKKSNFAKSFKLGSLATYSINDRFGIGIGVTYLNIGNPVFELTDITVNVKSKGLISTNVNLMYKF